MEVIWKTVTSLLNRRTMAGITFHDMLHGFWVGRGTGTATLEDKLLWKLTYMRGDILLEVFLEI